MEARSNVERKEKMQALASTIVKDFDGTPQGLKAVAADVKEFVESDVKKKSITDLLLRREPTFEGDLELGPDVEHKAYWMDENGGFRSSQSEEELERITPYVITARLVIDILDLRRGRVLGMQKQIESAEKAIIQKLDSRAIDLLLAACPEANQVSVSSAVSATAFNQALTKLEDLKLAPKLWVGRGSHFTDLPKDIELGFDDLADMQRRGVQPVGYGGGNLLYSPLMPADKIILLPDELPGVIADEIPLKTKEVKSSDSDKLAVNMFQSTCMVVTNPNRIAVVNIT